MSEEHINDALRSEISRLQAAFNRAEAELLKAGFTYVTTPHDRLGRWVAPRTSEALYMLVLGLVSSMAHCRADLNELRSRLLPETSGVHCLTCGETRPAATCGNVMCPHTAFGDRNGGNGTVI